MSDDEKKKGRSFSLSDKELGEIEARVKHYGFRDRNEYLLALHEAAFTLGLEPAWHERERWKKVLRLPPPLAAVAETAEFPIPPTIGLDAAREVFRTTGSAADPEQTPDQSLPTPPKSQPKQSPSSAREQRRGHGPDKKR